MKKSIVTFLSVGCFILGIGRSVCRGVTGTSQTGSDVAVFVNVNVVPMNKDTILSGQTLVVRNGIIESLGPKDKIPIPKEAQIIGGQGKYLLPGLADMHVHLGGTEELVLYLANGVTTVRNMWGTPQHLKWRDEIRAGVLLGPTIYTAGPLMDGEPPIWEGSTVISSAADALHAVEEQSKAGYDYIKVYNRLSQEAYDGILASAKKYGKPVVGHVPDSVGLMKVLSSGQQSIEHLTGYTTYIVRDDAPFRHDTLLSNRLRNYDFIDSAKIDGVVKATVASGVWNCVTLIVYQSFVPPSEALSLLERPEMKYVSPTTVASWDPTKNFRTKKLTEEDYRYFRKGDTLRSELTRKLHEAGALILLGTDAPNPFVVPGFSIHDELQNLIDAGFTPYEAIKSGTYDAARFFCALDTFGVIDVGRRADLILVEGNPLDDIKNLKRLTGVMVRGRWHPQADLQRQLDSLVAFYNAPKDRFVTLPPLEVVGKTISKGRYEIFYNDVVFAEERFVCGKTDDGTVLVISQQVSDPPYGQTIIERAQYDDAGSCISLWLERISDAGTERFQLLNGSERLVISGQRVDGTALQLKEQLPNGTIILGTSVTVFGMLWPQLRSLGENDSLVIEARSMTTFPMLDCRPRTLCVKQESMREPESGVPQTDIRYFGISVITKSESFAYRIGFSLDGNILSLTEIRQMGNIDYRRTE